MSALLEELAEARAAMQERKAFVTECEREARESPRRGEREREQALAYRYECGEKGIEPDPEVEARLGKAVLEAMDGLILRPVQVLLGEGMTDLQEVLVDPGAERQLEGARAALEAARVSLRDFIAINLPGLVAEMVPEAQSIQKAATEAYRDAHAAAGAWESFRSRLAAIAVEGGQDALIGTIPENPLMWLQQPEVGGEIPLPLPEVFV